MAALRKVLCVHGIGHAELDEGFRESWRLAITVVAVTVVAAAFGALLRRRQWRELDLERQIADAGFTLKYRLRNE